MKVKNKFGLNEIKALNRQVVLPHQIMLGVLGVIFTAVGIVLLTPLLEMEFYGIFLGVVCLAGGVFEIIYIFFMPSIMDKKSMKNNPYASDETINEFTFDDDGKLYISITKNGTVLANQTLMRNNITKIKETQEYLFLYLNRIQAFIISKSENANQIYAIKEWFNDVNLATTSSEQYDDEIIRLRKEIEKRKLENELKKLNGE